MLLLIGPYFFDFFPNFFAVIYKSHIHPLYEGIQISVTYVRGFRKMADTVRMQADDIP